MSRAKKTISIPVPRPKERGIMPKPTRVIPDPKKVARKTACRKNVVPEEDREDG